MRTRKSAEPSMAVRVTERLMDQAKTGIEVTNLTFCKHIWLFSDFEICLFRTFSATTVRYPLG